MCTCWRISTYYWGNLEKGEMKLRIQVPGVNVCVTLYVQFVYGMCALNNRWNKYLSITCNNPEGNGTNPSSTAVGRKWWHTLQAGRRAEVGVTYCSKLINPHHFQWDILWELPSSWIFSERLQKVCGDEVIRQLCVWKDKALKALFTFDMILCLFLGKAFHVQFSLFLGLP